MARFPIDLTTRSYERILLIKPSSLGDVVHALPVLHGLRTRYPEAQIDWLIAPPFAPLIEHHPDLSNVIVFDRHRFGRIGRNWAATRAFLRFLADLRRARYDLVIDLQGLFRSGFMSWASRAPTRIGFREARECAWAFYNRYIPPLGEDAHAIDRNYQTAEILGFADVPARFELAMGEAALQEADRLLAEAHQSADRPLITLAPGARWETKRWPADKFAQLIGSIQSSLDADCLLIGSPDEGDIGDRVARFCEAPPANLIGGTTLPQMVAIVARSHVIVCHDSAVMHVAVALRRPLVCLTGPTSPRRTGPYQRPEDVLMLEIECSPCRHRRLTQCPHGHRCMQNLSVDAVVDAVRRRLRTAADPGT
ncbi:MAG: lipopolysaccharide heptosyltransferase II [Phycisphaerales bacterium]|nr:MAG: lipopolysaccharide heptosyltransferase II [Phycisphaerales bacterium]